MARVLGVSTTGYYAWRSRSPCLRGTTDDALLKRVRTINAVSRDTYGAPRVRAELRAEGWAIGKKRIARLMRTAGPKMASVDAFYDSSLSIRRNLRSSCLKDAAAVVEVSPIKMRATSARAARTLVGDENVLL
jgi:hypothetical protein